MIRVFVLALTMLISAAAAFAGGGGGAGGGRGEGADPLRPAMLSADAVWVVHVDLRALRSGPLGVLVASDEIERSIEDEEEREAWRKAKPILEKLRSITLYGNTIDEQRGVIVVRTESGVEEFFAAIAAHGEAPELIEEKGRTLRVWASGDGPVYAYADPRPGAGEPRAIIVGQHRGDLDAAIELIEGRAASMEGVESPFAVACRPREGTVVFAAASDLGPLRENRKTAMVLKNAEMLRVELGEHAGSLFAEVAVTTADDETARQMADVLRGLTAMGQMALAQHPEAAEARELLSGLEVTMAGRTTTVGLSCPASKLLSAIEAAKADRPRVKKMKEKEPAAAGDGPAKAGESNPR